MPVETNDETNDKTNDETNDKTYDETNDKTNDETNDETTTITTTSMDVDNEQNHCETTSGTSMPVELRFDQPMEVCDSKSEQQSTEVKDSNKKPIVGKDRGLQPVRIIKASQVNSKLMFMVSRKNGETDLLESSIVYKHYPVMAIHFFMEKLTNPATGINI